MKIFAHPLARFAFCILIFIGALFELTACATVKKHSATVEFLVSQATMRYIERSPAALQWSKAVEVLRITDGLLTYASREELTVNDLATFALQQLPETMSPADRAAALGIINIARQELSLRLSTGTLRHEELASVRGVLDSIRFAAQIYSKPTREVVP